MITGFFLNVFYAVINFFVGLLPITVFPAEVSSAIAGAWYYINALSFLLPVGTILTVLLLAFTFHAAIWLWRMIHLIATYIRGN